MNRSIHFRVSQVWFNLAVARAEKLGLSLSEYVRSVVTKDVEEGRNREEIDRAYIPVFNMIIENMKTRE